MRGRIAVMLALAATFGFSPSAVADELDGVAGAVLAFDTVVPSIWAEFEQNSPVRALLLWSVAPIAIPLVGVGNKVQRRFNGTCWETRAVQSFLIPFAEPQIRLGTPAQRIAFGGTLPITVAHKMFGFHLDGGGVVGSDGNGWFAGGGFSIGPSKLAPWGLRFGVTVRWFDVSGPSRFATGFDLTTAMYPRGWVRVFTGGEARPPAPECPVTPQPVPNTDKPTGRRYYEPPEHRACDPIRIDCSEACGAEVPDHCGGTIKCPPCPVPLPDPDAAPDEARPHPGEQPQ